MMFDRQKFNKARYDVHKPLDVARFQHNVMEFMDLVRKTHSASAPSTIAASMEDSDSLFLPQTLPLSEPAQMFSTIDGQNRQLVNEFCRFIDDKEVWHLAQMVIPEFRLLLVE